MTQIPSHERGYYSNASHDPHSARTRFFSACGKSRRNVLSLLLPPGQLLFRTARLPLIAAGALDTRRSRRRLRGKAVRMQETSSQHQKQEKERRMVHLIPFCRQIIQFFCRQEDGTVSVTGVRRTREWERSRSAAEKGSPVQPQTEESRRRRRRVHPVM